MSSINEQVIAQALDDWASLILRDHQSQPQQKLALVGLISHGDILARRLQAKLAEAGCPAECGALDISLYRDDFTMEGRKPALRSSYLPFSTDGLRVILIDDVVYTGRTIRAALNALFDYGRPAKVELHCLVERSGRELPIQPNFCALTLPDGGNAPIKLQLKELDGVDAIHY